MAEDGGATPKQGQSVEVCERQILCQGESGIHIGPRCVPDIRRKDGAGMWFLMVLVFTITPHQSWPIAGAPTYRACQDLKKQIEAEIRPLHHPKKRTIKLECQK